MVHRAAGCYLYASMVESPTIYIVDDDDAVRRSLSRLMRSCGYSPVSFASVDDFLASPRTGGPACVIADVTMRGSTGMAVAKSLADQGGRLPVILITASDSEDMRAEARRVGASAYLRKPVDDQALVDSIEWALQSCGSRPNV